MKIYSNDMPRIIEELSKPFDEESVSFRFGQVKDNNITVLAYIDARDVVDRLNQVVGAENWQRDNFYYGSTEQELMEEVEEATGGTYTKKKKVLLKNTSNEAQVKKLAIHGCRVGLKIWTSDTEFEWIWKSDTAGDSAAEQEKGGPSDAFKRAAVNWGIGAYLYKIKNLVQPKNKDLKYGEFDKELAKKQYIKYIKNEHNLISRVELENLLASTSDQLESKKEKIAEFLILLRGMKSGILSLKDKELLTAEQIKEFFPAPEVLKTLGVE